MGCKYACTCGGMCPGCSSYEPEEYFGHAEDICSQARGFASYDDEMEHVQRQRAEEEAHYANMQEEQMKEETDGEVQSENS